MIRINLLPFRAARRKENIRRQVSIFFLSVICLFALMGYFYLSLNNKVDALKVEKAGKTRELATYAKTTKMIKEIKRKIRETQNQLDVIKGLEKNKTGPVRMLDEIAMAVPRGKLYLKSLRETGGTLRLSGTAMDNDTVALFMTNLEKKKSITSVDLNTTRLTTLAKQKIDVSDFALTCKTYAYQEKKPKRPVRRPPKRKR